MSKVTVASSPQEAEQSLVQAIGPYALAAAIINIIVGAGIFAMPARLYDRLGTAAPLAFILGALAIIPISMCFAAMGSRAAATGGPYTYGRAVFGSLVGFIAGALMWICNVASSGGVSAALIDQLAKFFPSVGSGSARVILLAGIYLLLLALNAFGVKLGTRTINILAALKLTPLFVLTVIGMFFVDWSFVSFTDFPSWAAMGPAMILVIFAYSGIETALIPSGEVKDASRNIPKATAIAVLLVVLLYIGLQIVTQGLAKAALAGSTTPIADAAGTLLPVAKTLLLITACLSMLGFLMGNLFASSRLLFALGRDGFLPSAVGRVDARHKVPQIALAVHASIAFLLAARGNFEALAILSGAANCLVYVIVCIASWRAQSIDLREKGSPFVMPLGPLVPILSVLIMGGILYTLPAPEWRAIGIALAILLAIYALIEGIRRLRGKPLA